MHSGTKLARALRSITPKSFDGDVARRVGLAGLLTPLRSGGGLSDLQFLYAGRRRNRFTSGGGSLENVDVRTAAHTPKKKITVTPTDDAQLSPL